MKWISVDERLPEPGQIVVCIYDGLFHKMERVNGGRLPLTDTGGISNYHIVRELVHSSGEQWANEGVTHWMPLPPVAGVQP